MNFNLADIMKQMGVFQEKLAAVRATGSAGGGMVEVELNGKFELLSVKISPEAVEGGDIEMLEDLIAAAFTNGLEKVRESIGREVGSMTGGLNIPGLSGLMGGL